MKIIANGIDLSNLIEKITWAGDESQFARKLTFSYLFAPEIISLPKVVVELGNRIQLYTDENTLIFDGIALSQDREESDVLITINAQDYAFYLKNKVFHVYEGSPQEITFKVCSEFAIPVGVLAQGNKKVKVTSTGDKSIYQVIADAYEQASIRTNIYMTGMMLNVGIFGADSCSVVSGDTNVKSAKYTSSIENMINKVVILDDKGNFCGETNNALDIEKYGLMQEAYKKEKDKNATKEAAKLLKTIANTGNITIKADFSYLTGKSIFIQKVNSLLVGKFFIISDSHSLAAGEHTASLGLEFLEVI